MSNVALFVKHRALPGKRDDAMSVWERHMQPLIARNQAHEAYFYCFDESDPDLIHVYQQYSDFESSQAFLEEPGYARYLEEVEPYLAGAPEITVATPMWIKGA